LCYLSYHLPSYRENSERAFSSVSLTFSFRIVSCITFNQVSINLGETEQVNADEEVCSPGGLMGFMDQFSTFHN